MPFAFAAGLRSDILLQAANGLARGRVASRPCRGCGRHSLFIGLMEADESWRCVLCGSNRRYELAGEVVRRMLPELIRGARVVETDFRSPLRPWIDAFVPRIEYIRTAYIPGEPFGMPLKDRRYRGARNEDLTAMSFEDQSVDLLIACDVLEHIEQLDEALKEIWRVLKRGGTFVFSIPQFHVVEWSKRCLRTELNTRPSYQKARSLDGDIVFSDGVPEFHIDPHSPFGIPVFWSFGPDAMEFIQTRTLLHIERMAGPYGPDKRVIFRGLKD